MTLIIKKVLRTNLAIAVAMVLSACVTYEYHETRPNQLTRADAESSLVANEDTLLDIGVVLLDDGVELIDEDSVAYANVRRSEAVWFSEQLKTTLESSNAWGLVRTLPNNNIVFDLTVEGQILESNGEDLRLIINAYDASGQQWLSKEYYQRVSQYAYSHEVSLDHDPFQNLFNDIANDLFVLRSERSEQELLVIREIARLRFAEDFAPQVFASYVEEDDTNVYRVHRVPADNDPMIERIEQIRARNDLFLDVLQDYYRIFENNMTSPYSEWRKISYKDVLYQRQLEKQAKQERIAGAAIIAAGVLAATGNNSTATRAAGHIGIGAGATLFQKSFGTETEASLHAETLREFGESLEVELEPSVIDLQERSVTLTGTVEDQYKEWRRILQEMFDAEQSILEPEFESLETEAFQPTQDSGSQVISESAEFAQQ